MTGNADHNPAKVKQAYRLLMSAAAGDIALGILIMLMPVFGRSSFRVITGAGVIVAGLTVLGWTLYFKRRAG